MILRYCGKLSQSFNHWDRGRLARIPVSLDMVEWSSYSRCELIAGGTPAVPVANKQAPEHVLECFVSGTIRRLSEFDLNAKLAQR